MAAPTATRPRKLLASLVETLERTKATAGVVDGGATDFESCKQFALSVYARADRGDRARPPNAVPTRAHVEAFSAAGTFLTALEHFEHFGHAKTSDLAIRKRYAEWRAWDLATAAREDRGASSVDEESHGAKAAPTEGNRNHREENASFDAAARAATTTTMRAAFSANAVETSTAAETRFAVSHDAFAGRSAARRAPARRARRPFPFRAAIPARSARATAASGKRKENAAEPSAIRAVASRLGRRRSPRRRGLRAVFHGRRLRRDGRRAIAATEDERERKRERAIRRVRVGARRRRGPLRASAGVRRGG